MKTIKIVDIQKICNGCKFDTPSLCDKGIQDIVGCEEGKEDASVIEQIPETWEELKELCKNTKGIEFTGGNAKGKIIQLNNIWFAENGDIWSYTDDFTGTCNIAKDRTPQQMWNIIKSLIGEYNGRK